MTDEMIEEAVARAICCPNGCDVASSTRDDIAGKVAICQAHTWDQTARAAIAAHKAALAKAGLGIRPREPTEEMGGGPRAKMIWRDMWDGYEEPKE